MSPTPSNPASSTIPHLPPTMQYHPNFLAPGDIASLITALTTAHHPAWTALSRRRVKSFPSALTPNNALLSAPLPQFLTERVLPKMHELGIWDGAPHGGPNHVLVNEYLPGQGIMPHEDGGAYWPVVATVSLGGAVVLELTEKGGDGKRYRVLQEGGSLLVTTGEMYTGYLHGIAEVFADGDLGPGNIANWDMLGDKSAFEGGRCERELRISLTYRDVLKVSNIGGVVLGRRR